ncbi:MULTISPECIES: hypothetical protein [unclassified Mesorhizobium]|uniref:hypothetical protein n=1 Tax=unclassified Mesorhizobium TaxID=325217 RepID=UPI00333C408A
MTRGILVTGVMGGMIAATLLGIFFVPLFFTLVARLSAWLPPCAMRVCRKCRAAELKLEEGLPLI